MQVIRDVVEVTGPVKKPTQLQLDGLYQKCQGFREEVVLELLKQLLRESASEVVTHKISFVVL